MLEMATILFAVVLVAFVGSRVRYAQFDLLAMCKQAEVLT